MTRDKHIGNIEQKHATMLQPEIDRIAPQPAHPVRPVTSDEDRRRRPAQPRPGSAQTPKDRKPESDPDTHIDEYAWSSHHDRH